jgi:pimeloyl-ACP methyl ester carboxylesterase
MGAHVDVNGLSMYYEAAGEGEPVVLVHGTSGTAESWTAQRELLTDWYRLLMPECRGHGRTVDADIAAFIDALGVGPVRLVGWGDGAKAALRLARHRPGLVRQLVLIGCTAEPEAVAALAMPLLVMQGDDDSVAIARSAALARTAPNGRLAVVPGTSHLLPLEKPEIVNLVLLDFFEAEIPARM